MDVLLLNFIMSNFLIKILLLFLLFIDSKIIIGRCNAKVCIPILNKDTMYDNARDNPQRVWTWDKKKRDFVSLEALENNGLRFCSVDYLQNMTDVEVKVSLDTMYPYIHENREYASVKGYIVAIWKDLEQELKFKSNYTTARSHSIGEAFLAGTHDVSLAAVAITTYRAAHYSYSHQITTNSYSLFTLSEGTRVSAWWYAKIFSGGLWSMTFVSLVVITFVLFTMYRFKKAMCYNYLECNDELSALSFILLCVIGGITGQGIQKIPTSWSLRCLLITSLIMGVLISCGFNSTLTSHLAIKISTVPLSSLDDIAELRTHSLCLREKSAPYFRLTINESVDGPLHPKWRDIINTGNCPNMDNRQELMEKLCEPKLVYFESPETFLPVYKKVKNFCEIVKISGDFLRKKIAIAFATSWPYRKLVNKYLLKYRSVGILNYLEKSSDLDNVENKLNFQPVEHGHIKLIFIGLCFMFIISTIICILENIWFRFQRSSELNKRKKKLQAHVQRRLKQWNSTSHLTNSWM